MDYQPIAVEYKEHKHAVSWNITRDKSGTRDLIISFWEAHNSPELETLGDSQSEAQTLRAAEHAISWILALDAKAGVVFSRGGVVSRRLEARAPIPLPTPRPGDPVEIYWKMRIPVATLARPLFFPTGSPADLLTYQRVGVDWLRQKQAAILADDMGLGKTVQALAACNLIIEAGEAREALVIAPRSLLATWEDECTKWAPGLTRLRVVPATHIRDKVWEGILGRMHIFLTSYEHMRSLPKSVADHTFDLVIVDEAHRIRNLHAFTTRGVRRLKWKRFWALTGTPIERDSADIVSLLSTIDPGRFSIYDARLPIEVIRRRARPYVLRRLKSDVMQELPNVIESKESLDLLPAQARTYAHVLDAARSSSTEISGLLEVINKLRTICDFDPDTGESAKVERISEIVANIRDAGEKCVVFSYLIKPLDLLEGRLKTMTRHSVSVRLDGTMDLEARSESIGVFKRDPNLVALLASSRIGGEGLTLTEANHVIFFNEWWNPSANAQARDRVVRFGQKRGVRVYRFRCRETIEDLLEKILIEKESTFAELVDKLVDPRFASERAVVQLVRELRLELASLPTLDKG